MPISPNLGSPSETSSDLKPDLAEIVMGLHWDPPNREESGAPADLDALCVVFDSEDRVLDVVHPGHQRTADGSIIHTGDSKTGASLWDDERIFVFLDALSQSVSRLAFVVMGATERPFDEVGGAFCHVSDRLSETEFVRVDLTSLIGKTTHAVATVRRATSSWKIDTDQQIVTDDLLTELRLLVANAKSSSTVLARFS